MKPVSELEAGRIFASLLSVTKSTSQLKAGLLFLWAVSKFFPVSFYFKEQNLIISRKLVHLNPGPVAS